MRFLKPISLKVFEYGSYACIPFIFSIYFSTSVSAILAIMLCLAWLLSGECTRIGNTLKAYPIAVWALLLYGYFILAMSYGNASFAEGISMLKKYREFLFIPIFLPFLGYKNCQHWAWLAFMAASIITLLGSYLMDFGLLDVNRQGDPCFKSRITHSILIAFFMFHCAHQALDSKKLRVGYCLLVLLSVYNLFFVVQGRTGQLVAVMLSLLFAIQRFGKREIAISVGVIAIFLAAFIGFSDKSQRIHEGIANTESYLQAEPDVTDTSMGQRYTFWQHAVELIKAKPVFGYGTGGFAPAYHQVISEESLMTKNPHNEFLMIAVQWGAIGLLLYLGFLASQYYYAQRLPDPGKWYAEGILVTLVGSSLFNSPFLDHSGHWFAVMIALVFAASGEAKKHG